MIILFSIWGFVMVKKFLSSDLSRKVVGIAWPIVLSELGDSLYSIVDTYFVSRLGTLALNAVAIGSYLSWLFFVLVVVFSTGILVFVSQSYGAREIDKARKALGATILFAFATLWLAVLIIRLYSYEIVLLVAGNKRIADAAQKYFSIRILGLPFLAVSVSMDSSLRAIGATKYSMIAVLSSALLNMFLDPILIFGINGFSGLGVEGAALATLVSIVYMIPVETIFLAKTGLFPVIDGFKIITTIIKIGLPTSFERFLFSLGHTLYLSLIARCGEIALAAHQIGVRIESLIYMPGFAFSVAASALVGQKIGAGDYRGAREIGLETIKISVLVMGILGFSVALASTYIVKPFSPTSEVAYYASIYLIFAGLSEPGLSLAMTTSGAIRGAGNTLIPMIAGVTGLYLFRIAPAILLMKVYGVIGAWIAMFIDVYLRGAMLSIIYSKYFYKIARKIV